MTDKEREFVRDIKVLITRFEYEKDKDEKEDIVDSIAYHAREFEKEYCK